jgi:hypothetical protein
MVARTPRARFIHTRVDVPATDVNPSAGSAAEYPGGLGPRGDEQPTEGRQVTAEGGVPTGEPVTPLFAVTTERSPREQRT